jgi:uncharacterized protein YjiS (DUF1127 family)
MSSTHVHSRYGDGPETFGKQRSREIGNPSGPLVKARRLFDTWANRSAERRTLARLAESELKDIGISRYDAEMESRKPFWRS